MPQRKDRFVLAAGASRNHRFGITIPYASHSPLSLQLAYGLEAFRSLRGDWIRLYRTDGSASPYNSWNWVESWIEAYGKGRQFLAVVCCRGEEVVGIVPFTWPSYATPLELRKMWMLGFHSWIGTNGLTEEPIFAIDADPRTREQVWNAVHEQMRKLVQSGRWDSVAYRRFGSGLEGCSVVESKDGNNEVQDYRRGCEYVELPATWNEYLKTVSKSMRENIPYYRRKFQKEGIDMEVREVDPADIPAAIDTLIRLHKMRTYTDPALLHVDYFKDRRQSILLKRAAVRMAATGEAKVVTLTANGKVIAAQVFLENGRQLLAHYSGFDPEWSKFSPLFVLQAEVIKGAIERGFTTLNLLRGNAEWQRRWGADSHNQIVDVTIGRRKLIPRVRQVLQHREALAIHQLANAPSVRRIRATYRTWQLERRSA